MNKEKLKNVLIVIAIIICIPLIYKLLSAVLRIVALIVLVAAAYYIGWPWLKRKFGNKNQ